MINRNSVAKNAGTFSKSKNLTTTVKISFSHVINAHVYLKPYKGCPNCQNWRGTIKQCWGNLYTYTVSHSGTYNVKLCFISITISKQCWFTYSIFTS